MSDWMWMYFGVLILLAIAFVSGLGGFIIGGLLFGLLSLPPVAGGVVGMVLCEGAALSYALSW